MNYELALHKDRFDRKETTSENIFTKLKAIANDSLFFFGLFLAAFFLLQSFPLLGGLVKEVNIGINEVVVSAIGFLNVFLLQVFNKIFCRTKG